MKFIELTDLNDKPFVVRVDNIRMIFPNEESNGEIVGTRVHFMTGQTITVKNSYDWFAWNLIKE